jgi:hypothetical protein
VPPQDVGLPVAREVRDSRHPPVRVGDRRQENNARHHERVHDPETVRTGQRVVPQNVRLAVAREVRRRLHLPVAVALEADALLRADGGAVHQPDLVLPARLVAPEHVRLAVAVEVGANPGGGDRYGEGEGGNSDGGNTEGNPLGGHGHSSPRWWSGYERGAERTLGDGRALCVSSQGDGGREYA